MHLKEKRAVVTGGGGGIGAAIGRRFAQAGAEVIIFDLANDDAQKTLDDIHADGGQAQLIRVDVADTDEVESALDEAGPVDIMVNNAGISLVGDIENTSPEDLDRAYEVNVKGVYNCMRASIPGMILKGGGAILNLASIASKMGLADRFAYSMSKGAVLTMTYSVAKDYVSKGIRCNCICPGRVHTPFVDRLIEKNYPENKEEMFAKLSAFQPLGRMGTPDEIASLALYLCSDEAAFITGAAYDIDGGCATIR
ncbi:MAG: SDR family NAD(P)-dependent oxidoreductase [Verrucomicrobiota bacterium]